MEGGIQRTLFDSKKAFGNGLDMESDPEAVIRAAPESFEYQEWQRSHKILAGALSGGWNHSYATYLSKVTGSIHVFIS